METLDTASTRRLQPGSLSGHVRLTVQTLHAQRLIWGRAAQPGVPAIIGLVGCADRLRLIWLAVCIDDPYADWFLLRVEAAQEQVRALLKAERAALPAFDDDALEVELAASTGRRASSCTSARRMRIGGRICSASSMHTSAAC